MAAIIAIHSTFLAALPSRARRCGTPHSCWVARSAPVRVAVHYYADADMAFLCVTTLSTGHAATAGGIRRGSRRHICGSAPDPPGIIGEPFCDDQTMATVATGSLLRVRWRCAFVDPLDARPALKYRQFLHASGCCSSGTGMIVGHMCVLSQLGTGAGFHLRFQVRHAPMCCML